jgi:hypothetical protein
MDAIKTYIDNVFAAFPQTERLLTLKRDMLSGMEEKYHALKDEGKSEHEAVGGVIANFGSIDEIVAELGIEQHKAVEVAAEDEDTMSVSGDEAREYLSKTKRAAYMIGAGVWMILGGVSAMLMLNGIIFYGMNEALGIIVLMFAIAAAIPLFVVGGLSLRPYESYEEKKILLDSQTRFEIEQKSSAFAPIFAILISVAIGIILLGAGTMVAFLEILEPENENAPIALFLILIGFSVFLFTSAGMNRSAFDVLLGKGEYISKKVNKQIGRLIGTIAAVYWPLIVGVFLLWSFLGDAWEISWIVWPVAGVVFGAVAGGIGIWFGTKTE